MIKAYKCIMTAMLLCPTVLTGCSDEKDSLEQEGEKSSGWRTVSAVVSGQMWTVLL